MSVLRYIQPKIHSLTGGLFANWMPNNSVSIGDFGTLQRCAFERHGSLKEYDMEIEAINIDGGNHTLEYRDKSKVNIGSSVAASEEFSGSEGSVSVHFSDRGAFLYHLSGVNQERPTNMKEFHEKVGQALLSGILDFPDNGVLVTEIQQSKKATIIVSDGKKGTLELKTEFRPTGKAFLSGAKGQISAVASTGSLFQWIASDDTVTLLKLIRPVFPPPPGAPDNSTGITSAVVELARNLVGGRQLDVNEFLLKRYIDEESPSLIFAISDTDHEIALTFRNVTVSELLETDEKDMTIDDDESNNIDIEQVTYQQHSGTATG